jgi:hypothetical protein
MVLSALPSLVYLLRHSNKWKVLQMYSNKWKDLQVMYIPANSRHTLHFLVLRLEM